MIRNRKSRWSKENVLRFKDRWKAVTIPVNITIDHRQITLQLDQVLSLIRSSETISVGNCFCRTELQNCDFPRRVCLNLNMNAIKTANDGTAEIISKTKAEKIISEAHQKGLVLLALHPPEEDETNIQSICSCCSCCCSAFQGLLRMYMHGLVKKSQYISTQDPEKCLNCGECISYCHFMARTLDDEENMTFNPSHCFGCGLCVARCSENAIEMVERVLS
ncbi:MAG: ATP-binding protein [Candidatus Hermodarchaeota archaeon]